MRVFIDTKEFERKMLNITEYSFGFIEGIDRGKFLFLQRLGDVTGYALSQYIDASARENPQALHHVYEWYQTGSPEARLFTIKSDVKPGGIHMFSNFRQSSSMSDGSSVPFFNKASVMESGQSVTIKPRKDVLVFESDGQTIFTRNDIVVNNPGGDDVAGAYKKAFDDFILKYFKQSFLRSSGIFNYLSTPRSYKTHFSSGSRLGRSEGIKAGYTWITRTTIGVEND